MRMKTNQRTSNGRSRSKRRRKSPYSNLMLILLCGLGMALCFSLYTATNVHIVFVTDAEGDDIYSYLPIQIHTVEPPPSELISSVLKRISGDGWEIMTWGSSTYDDNDNTNNGDGSEEPSSPATNNNNNMIRWINFTSKSGITRQMATSIDPPPSTEIVSRVDNKKDCDPLLTIWNKQQQQQQQQQGIYVEIGRTDTTRSSSSSCVMEMLLSTNAHIIVIDPHPMNQLCLKETMSRLEPKYQRRVIHIPVALGEQQGTTKINSSVSASASTSTSIPPADVTTIAATTFTNNNIQVERYDSIFHTNIDNGNGNGSHNIIKLMKIDARGYECEILEGMGSSSSSSSNTTLAKMIQHVKLKFTTHEEEEEGEDYDNNNDDEWTKKVIRKCTTNSFS